MRSSNDEYKYQAIPQAIMRLDNPETRQFSEVVESGPENKWFDEGY